MKNFSGWFPFPTDYSSIDLRNDVFAGLTVGFLLVPQAIAYAILAGVPPVYGIYAALVPMLIYSLLGSTPHVSVGPTALAGILALSSLSGFAQPADPEYMRLIFLLAALTGVVQLLFGVLRLGVLVNFLSRPVISGFVSAAAVLIAFSQVKPLFGIDLPRTSYLHNTILAIGQNFGSIHGPTALASVLCIIALIVLRKWAPKWPGILLLLVAATFLTAFFRLDRIGLSILGQLPSGFPAFILPDFGSRDVLRLLPAALVLGLISFVETLSIAKTFSESFDYYRVDPNRELIALGSSKFIGSFFQAIPTSASFSRSAVSVRNGTRTMVSSLISIVLVAAATFITPWFYYLPLPLLAAIIILSVKGLFDWKEMVRLWRLDKKDFAVLAVTFLVTLFGGLQFGIAAGKSAQFSKVRTSGLENEKS
ncbi:MAG: SulP family inorganic anion transporter [Bacteroidota bacterium]